MRRTFLFLLIFLNLKTVAQEKKDIVAKTEVKAVTVFMNGAQVTRKKTIDLSAGKSTIKFTDLSPYIDEKSIQVKTNNEVIVLSVNQQVGYTDSVIKGKPVEGLSQKLETLSDKIKTEETNLDVIKEELEFMKDNRVIAGKNQEVSLANLKQVADYYHERISSLKTKEVQTEKTIAQLTEEKRLISEQLIQGGDVKKVSSQNEIVLKVDTKNATSCEFELQYVVKNAGWYPLYDIRARNLDEPVELRYKANIHQNTKEDWKNVQVKLSSSDPGTSNAIRHLMPYYLNYYTAAPVYSNVSYVSGTIWDDKEDETIPGVTIQVVGKGVTSSTDMNGHYSIALPEGSRELKFSAIGYETQTVSISGSTVNARLRPDVKQLSETVVTQLKGKVSGVQVNGSPGASSKVVIRGSSSFSNEGYAAPSLPLLAPVDQIENQTSVDFDIKTPYTINSDNKNTTVDIEIYSLPATYEYYCIPKINKDAFLVANVLDWEKLNLLTGEANIFFENTFVGKTVLDLNNVSDTLKLSLGADKNIVVKREKMKDYTSRQFIGMKREEAKGWQISVKNNKKQAVNMIIFDQVPVSTNEQIEVNIDNVSGGDLNKENGEVKWKLKLDPLAKKDFNLKYKVRYPKERTLTVE